MRYARSRRRAVLLLLPTIVVVGALVAWSRAVPYRIAAAPATVGAAPAAGAGQDTSAPRTVVARKFEFVPPVIEVQQNDLVKIKFETEDIPHSFTLDEYRIAKRAAPGHPSVFEFRADKTGTFTFYCNLSLDEGCKKMRGQLIVHPR
jgi:heme/copper-type cytochrome/quinol oxidase subunit 2